MKFRAYREHGADECDRYTEVMVRLLLAAALAAAALGQQPCSPTPAYGLCEIRVEMPAGTAAQHPKPYLTAEVHAEFRSPKAKTFLMPGFWDGGRQFVIRFSPDEVGEWTYRITANFGDFSGTTHTFTANASESPGFIKPANLHHWQYTESLKAHLWMGDTCYRCASMDAVLFDKYAAARAAQKFTHVRLLVLSGEKTAFPDGESPDPAYFRELDRRVVALNQKGILADLILGNDNNRLAGLFPDWQARERYLRFLVAHYSAMNVTWQVVQEFEEYKDSKPFAREIGLALKKLDPYGHPRSSHAVTTSSSLAGDAWMNYITYQSSDDNLGAIEHLMYPGPQVNAEFGYEDSGAGKALPHHVDAETFRKRLWNATMNGQYPTYGNTGVYGGKFAPDAKYLDSPGTTYMTAWFNIMSRTRWWDLEPHFNVDGCRALALPGVEYLIYIEKPGPIDVPVEKHSYDVYWIDPATGVAAKEKKDWKGDDYIGEPPDKTHDWILHLSRDGKKEGMLKSYRFEAWGWDDLPPNQLQVIEVNPDKLPYDIEGLPPEITVEQPVNYTIKLKRETRGTRQMRYLLTGEIVRDGLGMRVLASGPSGSFKVPASILRQASGVVSIRIYGLNALGKLYQMDRVVPVKR